MNVISNSNKNVLKCQQIVNGTQTITFDGDQIQFDNYGCNTCYYVDTTNGKTNMNFDIKQLEGETLTNFTVTNLNAGVIVLNSRDLESQINDLYH